MRYPQFAMKYVLIFPDLKLTIGSNKKIYSKFRVICISHVYVQYHFLSYKLLCYTRTSSPEKSRNNTRGKNIVFFHVFDIANQLLTHHSPFAPLGQVDE